ncbi:MAG TPA: chemotaxis protein CheB [Bryobacteraceae bacterium]|jgi:two-component system CheB/CheR fusion protein|nr:chemotaxis protein CheB [Bryobacteraceae bacterium]
MPPKKKPSKAKAPRIPPPLQPTKTESHDPPSTCPVVAFGASAGGLEAFQELLENLPDDTGLAFVFIQHLDPKHTSVLGELLARSTRMPVVPVTDQIRVQANHLYVIPPNVGMRLENGRLLLTQRAGIGQHMPIDEFFRSLAEDQGSRSIAVVLSGTASDGTLGLKAVKAVGGITFAQDETARFDAMPRNAIAAGWVDLVLPPAMIAHEIQRLCQHPYVIAEPAVAEPAPPARLLAEPDRFHEIFQTLRAATGVDFMLYKQGTLHRRILRRMALNKVETVEQYARVLLENRPELQSLFHDILINVTGFFREAATFESLKRDVFPVLLRERSPDNPIRVWVPGCSTGEETYSVAICLMESLHDAGLAIPIQIFGTDLSEPALARARAGLYPESVAADVSPERLRRFFVKVDGQYQISRQVRDKCIFAQQNLTKDPPFSKLDLITCRNVLIYLGPALQAKAMRFFRYALKPTGFLVLGLSESVGSSNQLFTPIDNRLKIYTRSAWAPTASQPEDFKAREAVLPDDPSKRTSAATAPPESQRHVDSYILSHYSPAGVLIDEEMNILQFHGRTTPYLEHGAGEPTLKVNRMLRHELTLEFRRLFALARKNRTTVRSEPIRVAHLNQIRSVKICIAPMVLPGGAEGQYLVLFEEQPPALSAGRGPTAKREEKSAGSARRARELEEELNSTKIYLESVIEEQQAATEELKSANEEVQSSNEELQSTNEELLTAKEELQSTNEELITVNEEMHGRNAELIVINNDLNNLLSNVNIPIVMLGNDLRIRRFTPQAEKVLNLLPTDVGRPLGDFRSKLDIPDLEPLFLDAIENLHVKERQVQDRDGRWFSMWIRPYRTMENRIDGAVLVLFDITDRKQASEARYRRLFEASQEGIILAEAETGEILDLNPYLAKTFGISRPGSVGMKYWDLEVFRGSEVDSSTLRELQESETLHKNLVMAAKGGEWLDAEVIGNVYWEGEKRVIQINIWDLSRRRRREASEPTQDEVQTLEIDVIGRLGLAISHDFSNLLTTVGGYSRLLKRDLAAGSPVAEDVEQISRALDRATLLARQVLAFGRRNQPQAEVLDLNELLLEMELILLATLPPRMELRIERGDGLRPVKVERGRMEQTVLNLVRHARPVRGGGTLIVTTRNTTIDEAYAREHPAVSPGEYVMLEVSSSGPPTDEAPLPELEPLLSAGDRRYTALRAAGIYDAVRRSGGHLWAASELGRGNTFRIFLPPAAPPPSESVEAAHNGTLEKGTETILVVEPEEMVRSLTARVLVECGYKVWESARGSEALKLVRDRKEPVHLLLTAAATPEMSGRELAGQMATLRPEMRVLLTSSYADDGVESANGRMVLRKPFTPEVLSERVREVLDA